MSGSFRGKLTNLDAFVKGLDKKYQTQVGIFGDHNPRGAAVEKSKGKIRSKYSGSDSTLTNAQLGAIHEFGSFSRNIPARSFLRMPIRQKSGDIAKKGSIGFRKLVSDGKMNVVMERLGIAAENEVQAAFSSRGFGTWAPDSAETARRKGSSAPLIDTAQLRRAISSRVVPA